MTRSSILIKANDQHRYLKQTFPVIASQTEQDFEVILLYSGTNEATTEMATQMGFRVMDVASSEFSHPGTLNAGARVARGEFIVILSADAVPVGEQWLANLLRPFDDPIVAGVYGRHVPRSETPPHILDRLRFYIRYNDTPRYQVGNRNNLFSNACSALRRCLWAEHNFDERLKAMEDYEWGRWAQKQGYAIVYEPSAEIEHNHGGEYSTLRYLSRILWFRKLRWEIDYEFFTRHLLMLAPPLVGSAVALADLITKAFGVEGFFYWITDLFLLIASLALYGTVALFDAYADHPGS